jgi:hypothetical protein
MFGFSDLEARFVLVFLCRTSVHSFLVSWTVADWSTSFSASLETSSYSVLFFFFWGRLSRFRLSLQDRDCIFFTDGLYVGKGGFTNLSSSRGIWTLVVSTFLVGISMSLGGCDERRSPRTLDASVAIELATGAEAFKTSSIGSIIWPSALTVGLSVATGMFYGEVCEALSAAL